MRMEKNQNTRALWHGGDYNPEQWLSMPEILEQDIERFQEAGINTVSVGIFSWSKLEQKEGDYQLDWLEQIEGGGDITAFTAGDLSVQRRQQEDGRLYRRALELMAPYLKDEGFVFRGVRG